MKPDPISIPVYLLVMMLGSSTWLCVSSVWVELPLMVSVYPLPEGWSLPSYLTITIQLAAIGPILHWLCGKIWPSKFKQSSRLQIYICLTFGTISSLLLSVYWDKQAMIAGSMRSVGLFALLFCVSLVSCTSSILYLPSMFRFKPFYITAYFIGMGFSALIPCMLALAQGSGRTVCHVVNDTNATSDFFSVTNNHTHSYMERAVEPNFHVSTFYFVMFLWMLLCTVAFGLLNIPKIVASALNDFGIPKKEQNSIEKEDDSVLTLTNDESKSKDYKSMTASSDDLNRVKDEQVDFKNGYSNNNNSMLLLLLLVTFWCSALMNGILPSIQSYACLPYGPSVLYLTAILSNVSNPVGCFTLFFCQLKKYSAIVCLTIFASLLAAYIIVCALKSPQPTFGAGYFGIFACVSAWTLVMGLLAYLRANCGALLREAGDEKKLWWCGVFTQIGSFLGSLLMFPLVNVFNLFQSASSCP